MTNSRITQAVSAWDALTNAVLELKKPDPSAVTACLRESYAVLATFRNSCTVPKDVCRLLLSMEEFLYFCSVFEGKDVPSDFFRFQAISHIASALKSGFFSGRFEYWFGDTPGAPLRTLNMDGDDPLDYIRTAAHDAARDVFGIALTGTLSE